MISRKTTKIAALLAILSIAGFFIYKGVAGPMKINMPETNPVRLNSGLVGYWTLDGADTNWGTNTTNDRSGNGYNGTMTNMSTSTSPVPGKIGQALNFDGNDYVNLRNVSALGFNKYNAFTLSAWVKIAGGTGSRTIVGKCPSGYWNQGWNLRYQGNNQFVLGLEVTDASQDYITAQSSVYAQIDTWFFVVGTYDGSNTAAGAKIYVNGANDTQEQYGPIQTYNITNSNNASIGSCNNAGNFWNGSIDEVRVYNRAISASEVTELYNQGAKRLLKTNMPDTNRLTSGLVGYWTFDGQDTNIGSNTTNDRSGSGYNGTLSGTTKPSQTIGKVGQGLSFDGIGYISLGTPSGLQQTGPLSISAWIYPTTFSNRGGIINAANYFYLFRNNNGSCVVMLDDNDDSFSCSNGALQLNQWNHVVVTFSGTFGSSIDSSNAKIYINNISQSISVNQVINGGWYPVGPFNYTSAVIGSNTGLSSAHKFNGKIDEVRVYNRAISASEITELYQEGQTKINVSQANKLTSGLVGYWTMDGGDTNWTSSTAGTETNRGSAGGTGTLTNMSQSTTPTIGKIGQALNFDGSNDLIDMGNVSALNFNWNNAFSISAWVKRNSTGMMGIISKSDDNPTSWRLLFNSSNQIQFGPALYVSGATLTAATSNSFTSTSDWYHVVGAYDGSGVESTGIKIYVNGILENSTTDNETRTSGDTTNSIPVVIGARQWNGSAWVSLFNGKIDEVRVYNRALSASEVQELYNQGR